MFSEDGGLGTVSSSRSTGRRRLADPRVHDAFGEAALRDDVVLCGEVVVRREGVFRAVPDCRLAVFDVRGDDVREAAVRDGVRLTLDFVPFCCLPLVAEDEDRAAGLERVEDFGRPVVREVERAVRPLAAFGRLDPPAAGRFRARAGERGVFGFAMTRPFLANLDSFPISSVSSTAYRD